MRYIVLVMSFLLILSVQNTQAEVRFIDETSSGIHIEQNFKRLLGVNKTRSIPSEEETSNPPENFAIAIQIQFAYNSAELDASSKAVLNKIASALVKPNLINKSLVIAGHTDSRGSQAYNEKLGYQRAMAVSDYLAQPENGIEGVAKQRMQVISYGEAEPIDANDTEAAINRRVEFLSAVH